MFASLWAAPLSTRADDFVLLRDATGLIAGGIERTRVIRVATDGAVQVWVETSTDQLFEARTGQVDPAALLTAAHRAVTAPAAAAPATNTPAADLVLDHAPPTRWLVACLHGQRREWLGPVGAVPSPWVAVQDALLGILGGSSRLVTARGGRYLRGEPLPAHVATALENAQLLQTLTRQELDARPLLRAALAREQSLVAVPEQVDPFAGLRRPATDPNRAHVVVDGQAWLLRLLTYPQSDPDERKQETPR